VYFSARPDFFSFAQQRTFKGEDRNPANQRLSKARAGETTFSPSNNKLFFPLIIPPSRFVLKKKRSVINHMLLSLRWGACGLAFSNVSKTTGYPIILQTASSSVFNSWQVASEH
jgi:hypothetical protein